MLKVNTFIAIACTDVDKYSTNLSLYLFSTGKKKKKLISNKKAICSQKKKDKTTPSTAEKSSHVIDDIFRTYECLRIPNFNLRLSLGFR